MEVSNKYLKKLLQEMNNFLINNTKMPEDLAFSFVGELRVSNLIIPTNLNDDELDFPFINVENNIILPLFTGMDEFNRDFNEFLPLVNDFEFYANMVKELDLDGIVINPRFEDFFAAKELISQIPPLNADYTGEALGESELKDLAFNTTNDDLLKFIQADENFNKFEKLVPKLEKSTTLNAVISNCNGKTIRSDECELEIMTKKEGTEIYVAIFTDLGAVLKADATEYVQVSNLFEVVKHVLTNDMDGIIINPDSDNYFVPRNIILEGIDEKAIVKSELADAHDYAFKI